MPLGGRTPEHTNTCVDHEVITRGCGATETHLEFGDHKLQALRLEAVKTDFDCLEGIDPPDLEVGDVRGVVDVIVRIELVESNPVWRHVRGHT